MTDLEIEPLYTETEAARMLGVKFTWLRSEQYKGTGVVEARRRQGDVPPRGILLE